ncbi:MAG: flagellar hook capping protein [Armatimonadetes bacterium]|nr:flagellar hook capping protein [Armatimonadota bacterium]
MSGTITSVNGQSFVDGTPIAKDKSKTLSMSNFMSVLSAQLANQNPLEPMSDTSFFAQLAQMGTVQGMDELRASMNTSEASSLLGKTVTAVRPMTSANSGGVNSLVTGTVQKLTIKDGVHYLSIKEPNGGLVEVSIGNVQSVS